MAQDQGRGPVDSVHVHRQALTVQRRRHRRDHTGGSAPAGHFAPAPATRRHSLMAYAEKRGKGPAPWRVKYRLPSGQETSESGFETKAAALAWGRDQEARIREGRWADPDAGK